MDDLLPDFDRLISLDLLDSKSVSGPVPLFALANRLAQQIDSSFPVLSKEALVTRRRGRAYA
ncbi:MAG: hypothetical protein P8R54_12260 [Myxococcota bacterium]|nr:hypothetical protein [Myxococcota bacterium]